MIKEFKLDQTVPDPALHCLTFLQYIQSTSIRSHEDMFQFKYKLDTNGTKEKFNNFHRYK